MVELLAEDLVLVDHVLPEEPAQGRQGWLNQIAKIEDAFDEYEWRPGRVVDAGERVLIEVGFSGRSRAGVPVGLEFAQVWTIEEGRAIRLENHRSWQEAAKAAGLAQ